MAAYTAEQLAQFWTEAGGDPNQVPAAVAVAQAEQGSTPTVANWDVDGLSYGPWQIHYTAIPGLTSAGVITQANDLLNPVTNAEAAIYMSGNGQNWTPWTDPVAEQIMAQRNAGNTTYGTVAASSGTGATGSTQDPYSAVSEAEGALATVPGPIGAIATTVEGLTGAVNAITSVDTFFAAIGALIVNLVENAGPLIVFAVIGMVGALLLVFAFGEDLARTAEKIIDKLPVPPEV